MRISTLTEANAEIIADPGYLENEHNTTNELVNAVSKSVQGIKKPNRRPAKKFGPRLTMFLRRSHLFSGLFMLPWVLLYGFTALLFNHPSWLADSKTVFEQFRLPKSDTEKLLSPSVFAREIVEAANAELADGGTGQQIEVLSEDQAVFNNQLFASRESPSGNDTLFLDLNSGKGTIRKSVRTDDKEHDSARSETSLENGLGVRLKENPSAAINQNLANSLEQLEIGDARFQIQGLPTLEFDAHVDGTKKRLRFSPEQTRRRRGMASNNLDDGREDSGELTGRLTVVGAAPRELSVRSFLLRLHTAHGYPIHQNSRWFWAISVDMMFASMVFWGISGLVMWWQIKRTRKIGFVVLVASALVASILAFGMHWQLVHG